MSQHHSDPAREPDRHALPNIETFRGRELSCSCGGSACLIDGSQLSDVECMDCGRRGRLRVVDTKLHWYWWTCSPGCLPDSEPAGPFDTEAEALADAREGDES